MRSKHLKHSKHRLFKATSPSAGANGGSSAHKPWRQCVELAGGVDLGDMELTSNAELGGAQNATPHEPHGAG
jgi:hypothetical protein